MLASQMFAMCRQRKGKSALLEHDRMVRGSKEVAMIKEKLAMKQYLAKEDCMILLSPVLPNLFVVVDTATQFQCHIQTGPKKRISHSLHAHLPSPNPRSPGIKDHAISGHIFVRLVSGSRQTSLDVVPFRLCYFEAPVNCGGQVQSRPVLTKLRKESSTVRWVMKSRKELILPRAIP